MPVRALKTDDPWNALGDLCEPPPPSLFSDQHDTLSQWCEDHKITCEQKPLDFENRPWTRALYDDKARHMVIIKATQVGGSVCAIIRCLYLSQVIPDWRGWIYYFPTKSDVIDFSQTRVQPLIVENEDFARSIGELDKVGVRQVGNGYFYFRGMRTKVGLKSAPADGLVFDELDEATEGARQMALERLGASPYKFICELSNPSIPQFGIDLAYAGNPDAGIQGSDQRTWQIKCPHCGAYTCMETEFPRKIGEEDLRVLRPRPGMDERAPGSWYRACIKCEREIDPRQGEWVAAYPDPYRSHGYQLSQLYSPTVDPVEIVTSYREARFPHHFYNLKIGVAWVDAADRVAKSDVLRWRTSNRMLTSSHVPCTMGIDQGSNFHVIISRPTGLETVREVVHIGEHTHRMPEDWHQLDDLMRRFKVQRCVIDALPDQSLARAFALRHPGRVFLNFYDHNRRGRTEWNEDNLTVREDKTEATDSMLMCFRDAGQWRLALPYDEMTDLFAQHCAALVKQRVEEEDKSVVYRYKRVGPDHLANAALYDQLCWLPTVSPPSGVPTRSIITPSYDIHVPRGLERAAVVATASDAPKRRKIVP